MFLMTILCVLQSTPGLGNEWALPSHCPPNAAGDRRMSEPARAGMGQRVTPPMPPRPRSAQLPELHPNQDIGLDEVGEGEMVENKLVVIPDEMMQFLNQVQQGGNQHNYRGSPVPNCQSPICTNPQHCMQRSQPPPCSYNVQHQPQCYGNNQAPSCQDYSSVGSPYSQCPSTRTNQNYCSPHRPPSCSSQVASPGQVMSPGSTHYPSNHISDQPMTSPAAGALAPAQGMPTPHHNTAQMSRNCNQGGEHNNYYGYGCQGQMAGNCGAQQMAARQQMAQPCSPMHGNMPTCPGAHQLRPMGNACGQPMSPHCQQQQRPMSTGTVHNQCGMQMSSDQCSVGMPGNAPKPTVMAPVMSPIMADQCPRSVGSICSQPSPASVKGGPGSVHPADMQVQSPCSQMSGGGCGHPSRMVNPQNPPIKEAPRTCTPNSCHAQFCCQAQQQQQQQQQQQMMCGNQEQQPPQQYTGCGSECQWNYSNQCCMTGANHHGHCGNAPEIQCRDISQSQQVSPVKLPQGMRQDSYRRTLEYVQQCRNWSTSNGVALDTSVTSSTHPITLPQPLPSSANMIVNDMTSSLSSLLEENRYLQMIQ